MFQNFINKLKDGHSPFANAPGESQLPRRHTREKTFGPRTKLIMPTIQLEKSLDHVFCFSTEFSHENSVSRTSNIDANVLIQWSQTMKEPFIKAIEPIDRLIESNSETIKANVLLWLRGYLKVLHAEKINDTKASEIFLTNA